MRTAERIRFGRLLVIAFAVLVTALAFLAEQQPDFGFIRLELDPNTWQEVRWPAGADGFSGALVFPKDKDPIAPIQRDQEIAWYIPAAKAEGLRRLRLEEERLREAVAQARRELGDRLEVPADLRTRTQASREAKEAKEKEQGAWAESAAGEIQDLRRREELGVGARDAQVKVVRLSKEAHSEALRVLQRAKERLARVLRAFNEGRADAAELRLARARYQAAKDEEAAKASDLKASSAESEARKESLSTAHSAIELKLASHATTRIRFGREVRLADDQLKRAQKAESDWIESAQRQRDARYMTAQNALGRVSADISHYERDHRVPARARFEGHVYALEALPGKVAYVVFAKELRFVGHLTEAQAQQAAGLDYTLHGLELGFEAAGREPGQVYLRIPAAELSPAQLARLPEPGYRQAFLDPGATLSSLALGISALACCLAYFCCWRIPRWVEERVGASEQPLPSDTKRFRGTLGISLGSDHVSAACQEDSSNRIRVVPLRGRTAMATTLLVRKPEGFAKALGGKGFGIADLESYEVGVEYADAEGEESHFSGLLERLGSGEREYLVGASGPPVEVKPEELFAAFLQRLLVIIEYELRQRAPQRITVSVPSGWPLPRRLALLDSAGKLLPHGESLCLDLVPDAAALAAHELVLPLLMNAPEAGSGNVLVLNLGGRSAQLTSLEVQVEESGRVRMEVTDQREIEPCSGGVGVGEDHVLLDLYRRLKVSVALAREPRDAALRQRLEDARHALDPANPSTLSSDLLQLVEDLCPTAWASDLWELELPDGRVLLGRKVRHDNALGTRTLVGLWGRSYEFSSDARERRRPLSAAMIRERQRIFHLLWERAKEAREHLGRAWAQGREESIHFEDWEELKLSLQGGTQQISLSTEMVSDDWEGRFKQIQTELGRRVVECSGSKNSLLVTGPGRVFLGPERLEALRLQAGDATRARSLPEGSLARGACLCGAGSRLGLGLTFSERVSSPYDITFANDQHLLVPRKQEISRTCFRQRSGLERLRSEGLREVHRDRVPFARFDFSASRELPATASSVRERLQSLRPGFQPPRASSFASARWNEDGLIKLESPDSDLREALEFMVGVLSFEEFVTWIEASYEATIEVSRERYYYDPSEGLYMVRHETNQKKRLFKAIFVADEAAGSELENDPFSGVH